MNQMKKNGDQIKDKKICEKVLISLPKKIDLIVSVIKEIKDLSIMTIQGLMGSLKSFE